MRVIARPALETFCESHADAEAALKAWYQDARQAEWKTPTDIKETYANASILGEKRVVFLIFAAIVIA